MVPLSSGANSVSLYSTDSHIQLCSGPSLLEKLLTPTFPNRDRGWVGCPGTITPMLSPRTLNGLTLPGPDVDAEDVNVVCGLG